MSALVVIIGLVLIIYARVSCTIRIFNGKAKPFSGYTENESLIQWIGVAIIFGTIILI